MDPWSAVADEVALEGLDGITIPSLWIRLQDRQPKFHLKLDDSTKEFIWRSLIGNTDLKFYKLPEEREDVVLSDRFKDVDPETGTEIPKSFPTTKKDVYPVHIILENKDGIQGSCVFFKERTDITKHVRSKSLTALVSLEEALERYGRKLVVVASQTVRFRTLIGSESDPDLKLNDDSYCVLERVGRGRWQGELQSDLHGCAFKTDARKLHYMRKSLVRHGLVTMQSHVTRLKSGQQQHSILLLLNRFHVNRRSKYDILMECVSNILEQLPGQFATLITVKEQLNLNEGTCKRVFQYMRSSKLIEFCQIPLEELDPSAGPCTTTKGTKVRVRCLKLVKPYSKKGVTDDDDYDEDEEDETGARRGAFPPESRIMEKDVLSQAYHIVLSCGTKGIPKSGIGYRMNVGKLESRMLCRRLERDGFIKGFMEDVGRQRTTKYISHKCVGGSDQLQLFAKEQERKKLLYSSAPQALDTAPATPTTPSSSKSTAKGSTSTAKKSRIAGREGDEAELNGDRGKAKRKSGAIRKTTGKKGSLETEQTEANVIQPTPDGSCSESAINVTPDVVQTEQATEEGEPSNTSPASSSPQREASADVPEENSMNNIVVVKDVSEEQTSIPNKPRKTSERSHETYRLLRRKNLILEAVCNSKIIEGLFPLQKLINEEEKQDGMSSKCCKKTILRLVHGLSREGLLKIYTTTVVQDGITRKVEMIVHPSIQPNDDIVQRVIEHVRFKISSSYSTLRLQHAQEKAREQEKELDEMAPGTSRGQRGKADMKKANLKKENEFTPTKVRGLGKTLGFQPKMYRLRIVHNFLWYLIYGHPLRHNSTASDSTSETLANIHNPNPETKQPDKSGQQDEKNNQTPDKAAIASAEPQTADSELPKLDMASGDEEDVQKDESGKSCSQLDVKVYTDEESWKKFIPPVRVHKEFSSGWAMVGDLLLCLPLSIFVQVIQINYKVEGLEEYLSDPVKQHHLVRTLPARMRRQLLYKRKYLFSFHENLQKLCYMGLLQFGSVEKFKEKDLVFVYLKRNATIVDTTSAEPHYWLVTESPDKPFERRQYTFNTYQDVENYWFDLMCVCLNTPLGVIRSKKHASDDDSAPSFVHERNVFVGMAYLLKGSREECDDGSIPGDHKGAGGLDSEFFAHLKRNWLWTNPLLAVKPTSAALEAKENKIRLKSLLTRNALRMALKAGGTTTPQYLTTKRPMMVENVEVGIEPATRNQKVIGGKKQRRKRNKKEVVKVPRKKKKEPKKRTPAHDEADHRALKMMTRQRVYWSVQEDSLMMLCSVASHLLNSKLKRPFIPHCVVRDLLHAEFEISMDKTSVAVGRRTRYILKNPQTLLNYRICLAEVYQDKSLMRLLEENKPKDPEKAEDCAKSFTEYARLLRQKFSSAMNTCDMIMPDTKQELFSRFKVSTIDDGKRLLNKDFLSSTDDIHTIVLHNLIQSTLAMTNNQMKSSRSFQTFHMYSKYNQELLCQVFIECRKRGLINRRRVNQPFGPKKNRALPILPMSYQLSASYYRCFSWRFPFLLCTDSFRFMRSLINNGTRDDRPLTAFYHETENRTANGERQTGCKRKGKAISRTVTELEVQIKVPKLDSPKEGESNQTQAEGEPQLMERDMNKTGDDPSSKEQEADQLPKEKPSQAAAASHITSQAPEDPPDVLDMVQFSLDSPGGACMASLSLITLGLLSVHISIPKQMVVVDSNLVDNDAVKSMVALEDEDDEDYDGDECEGRKKMEVKAHQASHTNYLMMRGYCSPGIVKVRNLNINDNIVVESCNMKLQLRSSPAHKVFSMEDSLPLDFAKCGPSLLPSFLTYSFPSPSSSSLPTAEDCDNSLIQQKGYTPQDIEVCSRLRRSLDEAGENGLDIHDLHDMQQEPQSGCTRSLHHYLKDLQDGGQVLRVGGLGQRWVLMQHADPWLLTLNSKQWSQSRLTSAKLPFLENEHNIPFMRKRCRLESRQETEEPPAKKPTTQSEDGAAVEEGSSDVNRENKIEETQLEKQKESADEESGNLKEPEEKEGREEQMCCEEKGEAEEAGQEKMDTDERQEGQREMRQRKPRLGTEGDEAGSSSVNADENVSFISRPWRMVDGTLNRQVCKGMLEAILYHIMFRPGLTQQALVDHYKDVLQPMAVLDLIQALIDMGCVTKKTLVKAPKPSLFTRSHVHQRRSGTAPKMEEPDTVFYEPTISCCLRLAQVLPNERHWNYCIP
ncbi:general transcription factor 3C polypeptide 1 [Echeneis naucrates]|uniref:Uncharacterized protein n=1 Tax=Echeneis naucrates TaxID=173247 RepID=A0A665SZH1_ECHNA|nr:general transcription factor 3C polypeptide 1 [Echeneis naucrates]